VASTPITGGPKPSEIRFTTPGQMKNNRLVTVTAASESPPTLSMMLMKVRARKAPKVAVRKVSSARQSEDEPSPFANRTIRASTAPRTPKASDPRMASSEKIRSMTDLLAGPATGGPCRLSG
jgi:hypothetical protein